LAGTGLFDRVPRISLRATRRSDVRGSDMGAEIDDAERESYRREAPAPREEMVGMGPPAAFVSHGRAAFVAPDGRTLLWSDGDALHALDVPDAVALAWTSATRGAVIVGYRALKTTRDGGRTWRDVTLGAALPLGLAGRADGLYVDTSEGARRIGDDDALTPAATTRAPRGPLIASFEALYERSYARATEPTHACEPERAAEPENRWTPPRFVAALPQRRVGGLTQPAAPRGAASPLGTVRSRAFAHASTVPAVVSVTRPDDPVAGHPVALAWRGEDERGPFTVRVATTAPAAVSVHARWNVVAATRVGLLFLVEERRPGEDFARTAAERSLYWFGATGAQRVGVEMRAGEQLSALALDDGGAMVFARSAGSWRDFAQEPSLVRAIALGPDGAVRAQRAVVGAGVLREVLGLGEVAGRWGLVAAERATPEALTLFALDGATEPFGAWSVEGAPTACGEREAASARLHLLRNGTLGDNDAPFDVTLGPQWDGPEYAAARIVTFERGARGTACLRRVWGVRRLEDEESDDGSTFDDLWGAFRLTARGGRLVAVSDDGRTVATFPMTLGEGVGFQQDY
jgi:hypothetical protein